MREIKKTTEDNLSFFNINIDNTDTIDNYVDYITSYLNINTLENEELETVYQHFTENLSEVEAIQHLIHNFPDIQFLKDWEVFDIQSKCENFIKNNMDFDTAHDIEHIKRVVITGTELGKLENGNLNIILPACWLHDCVNVPKDSVQRTEGSKLSADKAIEFLKEINYPEKYLKEIHHAILAHSYSAKIKARTLEANIIQDADRLDALGAIGLARCLMYSGKKGIPLYQAEDPFAENREYDDSVSAIDHLFNKLEKISKTMNTENGKILGTSRWLFIEGFINEIRVEINR